MKKILLSLIVLLTVSAGAFVYAGNRNQKIAPSELPAKAQQFIKTHFGKDSQIAYAEKKWYSYEVFLSGGYEIDFDSDGSWKEIEAKYNGLPASTLKSLPQPISNYVSTNYKDWVITEMKRKRYGYKIELDSPDHRTDVELEFSHEGELLKIEY